MKDDEIGNGGGDGALVEVVEIGGQCGDGCAPWVHGASVVTVEMGVCHGAFVAALVLADFDGNVILKYRILAL